MVLVRTALARTHLACAWLGIAVLVWVAVSRALGIVRPAQFTIPLQSLTPWIFLPAYVVAALAAWRRRWVLAAVAAILAFVHIAVLLPAVGSHRALWATSAPSFRLLEANVYDRNATPDEAADALLAQNADVLVLLEVTRPIHQALVARGIDQSYPYRAGESTQLPNVHTNTGYNAIYSRLPLTGTRGLYPTPRSGFPMTTVALPGGNVTLVAVHVLGSVHDVDQWSTQIRALANGAREHQEPFVMAGDFNADRWCPPFGALLAAHLHDAHEQVGRGLSFSWPAWRRARPVIRIDHALMNSAVAARDVQDFRIPGSDHRGYVATLAVRSG